MPRKVNVKTEYLIYDDIAMIGNVGGTLGLFIGFSFTGLISFLLNTIINIISTIRKWTMKEKVGHNVTLVMSKDQIQGM